MPSYLILFRVKTEIIAHPEKIILIRVNYSFCSSSSSPTMTSTNLEGTFPLIARGKVRDIYQVDDNTLLFVATDRISAYDVIMANGIPNKGKS